MQEIIDHIANQPGQVVWDLILTSLFIVIDVLLILWVYGSNKLKQLRLAFKNKYQKELHNEIVELLIGYCMEENPRVLDRLHHLTSRAYIIRENILQQILSLSKSLSGDSKDKLKKLYAELDLKQISYRKLKSRKWRIVAKGILELEQMCPPDSLVYLMPVLRSPHKRLRREALLALVTLAPNPLYFLERLKGELTEWDCLLVYNKLKKLDSMQIPPFYKYFAHPKLSVKLFAINMTLRFTQYEGKDKLIAMLKHRNPKIQLAVMEALTFLEISDALDLVASRLRVTIDEEMILAYVKYIGNVGGRSQILTLLPFLNHPNGKIRSATVKGLIKMGYADFEHESEEINLLFKQFTFHLS